MVEPDSGDVSLGVAPAGLEVMRAAHGEHPKFALVSEIFGAVAQGILNNSRRPVRFGWSTRPSSTQPGGYAAIREGRYLGRPTGRDHHLQGD